MHYIAQIEDLGMEDPADEYRATLEVTEHVVLVAIDSSPFWAMCEMIRALKELGASGTIEGFYDKTPVMDSVNGNGIRIEA